MSERTPQRVTRGTPGCPTPRSPPDCDGEGEFWDSGYFDPGGYVQHTAPGSPSPPRCRGDEGGIEWDDGGVGGGASSRSGRPDDPHDHEAGPPAPTGLLLAQRR